MDQDTQSEANKLEAIQDVFTHPGFKLILKDLEVQKSSITNVMSIKDEAQLKFIQGRLFQIEFFTTLEDSVNNHLKKLRNPVQDVEDTY